MSDDTADALHTTADQYTDCQNRTSDYCWPDHPKQPGDLITAKRPVRDALYDDLKAETDLHANLVQAAIKQTVENVESCQTDWKKQRRISQPEYDTEEGWSMLFDKRSATFRKSRITVSLADGTRHTLQFVLPDNLEGTPYAEYVLSDVFQYRVTRIVYRPNTNSEYDYFAHIVTRAAFDDAPLPNPDTIGNNSTTGSLIRTDWQQTRRGRDTGSDTPEYRRVLGVDRNVNGYAAVTSAGGFYGRADHLNHRRREYEQVRAGLQQTGTQPAHQTMQSVKGREWRWFDQLSHHVANQICLDAIRVQATHVVFERLLDIRKRISNGKKYQQWFFRRIQEYVEYKLEPYDISVIEVNGAYTSQACSRMDCSHVADENRDGKSFECQDCGYRLDADLNAAKNIAYRYIREEWYDDELDHDAGEKWFEVVEQQDGGQQSLEMIGVSAGHTSPAGRAAPAPTGDTDSQPAPETTSASDSSRARIVLKSGLLHPDGQFARREWPTPPATTAGESQASPTLKEPASVGD